MLSAIDMYLGTRHSHRSQKLRSTVPERGGKSEKNANICSSNNLNTEIPYREYCNCSIRTLCNRQIFIPHPNTHTPSSFPLPNVHVDSTYIKQKWHTTRIRVVKRPFFSSLSKSVVITTTGVD